MTPHVGDIVSALDASFPLRTQDEWDNSGLLVGEPDRLVTGVLCTLDVTEAVLERAERESCNLVVAHHPLMLRPAVRRLTGADREQRLILRAVRSGIALAAFHTPLDKSRQGLSHHVARLLGLTNVRTLCPDAGHWVKVVSYVPGSHAEAVGAAMHEAGAGRMGNYDSCSWRAVGQGRFRPLDGSHPYCGQPGELHWEEEQRIEALCPSHRAAAVVSAIEQAHPYECPATDVLPLLNSDPNTGYGAVGDLTEPLSHTDLLARVAGTLHCHALRHSPWQGQVTRVALCTGSAIEFADKALAAGAQAYITADVKYHQMQALAEQLLVVDAGHHETERCAADILLGVVKGKFGNFAHCLSWVDESPLQTYVPGAANEQQRV